MRRGDWIICERTSRWASALRVALERQDDAELRAARICEVRNHRDLEAQLVSRPDALVTIEVDRANLAAVLAWLATAGERFPRARFVVGLDWSLCEGRKAAGDERAHDVAGALVEAGAALVLRSPREHGRLVELGRRHMAANSPAAGDELSPRQRVWASLPWQDR